MCYRRLHLHKEPRLGLSVGECVKHEKLRYWRRFHLHKEPRLGLSVGECVKHEKLCYRRRLHLHKEPTEPTQSPKHNTDNLDITYNTFEGSER